MRIYVTGASGFLMASSELVVMPRADWGTVASLANAALAGEPFMVWDGPGINQVATPVLATNAAELVWHPLQRKVTGTVHRCGGRHTDLVSLDLQNAGEMRV